MDRNCPHRVIDVPPEFEHLRKMIESGFIAKLPNDGPDWHSEVMYAARTSYNGGGFVRPTPSRLRRPFRARDNLERGEKISFVGADGVQCAAARQEGLDVLELAA